MSLAAQSSARSSAAAATGRSRAAAAQVCGPSRICAAAARQQPGACTSQVQAPHHIHRPQKQHLLKGGLKSAATSEASVSDAVEEITAESYVCLGMAQCFMKKDGTLQSVTIIEPLSASSLECLANGARTSMKAVTGVSLGDAMQRKREALPESFATSPFCENFDFRLMAAARTWSRQHAQDNLMDIVPLGKMRSNFNFSLEDKRVLNMENNVSDSDNVKQDMSIDVYGRKKAEDYAAGNTPEEDKAKAETAKRAQTEADLDTLLMA